jgi:two-component system CheB/CheR fusion protein
MYRALFEQAVNGIAFHEIVVDSSGRPVDYVFLEVNAAFEMQTGLRREAIVGRRVTEVLPGIERDPSDWIGRYGRVALTGEAARFELFSVPLDRWYDVAAFSPARGYFAVAFTDTTEHKRLERALREGDARQRAQSRLLEAVLDATHAQLALLDRDMRFVMVNDAYERASGYSREQLIGRDHFELFPHEENERIFRRVAESGEPYFVQEKPFEFPGQPERGVTYWNWSLVPVGMEPGRMDGVLLSLLEVTDQVAARGAVEKLAAERERSAQAARESEAILLECDRRKNEFLAVLSHELRNPLAPIRNALWLLERSPMPDPQAARAVHIVDRQVRHLTRLVDDLLDVTRITRGKVQLQLARVDLAAIVGRAVDDYRPLFAGAGVALELELPAAPAWLDADETRLAQIVGNLLGNAVKFSTRGGRVDVAVRRTAERCAEVSVRDEGAGLSPELLERVFEPFVQADADLERSRAGLGLGLALVKGLVELHGGSVQARSDGAGRGTELVIRLPGLREEGAPAQGGRGGLPAAPRRRVLLIDDNVDAADSMREVLAVWNHDVAVAYDGREGVEKAREFRPDLVLCDIGLPSLDGYEVAREIRADPALASTFLVAVTGYALPADEEKALGAGFHRHLSKPVAVELVAEVLASLPAAADGAEDGVAARPREPAGGQRSSERVEPLPRCGTRQK